MPSSGANADQRKGVAVNSTVRVILGRRSFREGFLADPVPLEVLRQVVDCGLAAPSSKNARPWRFHVVTNRRLLAEVARVVSSSTDSEKFVPFDPETGLPRPEMVSTVAESAAVLEEVPAAIFIENIGTFSGGREALLRATPEALAGSILGYTLEVMGVGAALQTAWLAAEALGLSGVFMGDVLIAEGEIKRRLGVANDLVGVLALGYAEPGRREGLPPRHDRQSDCVRWIAPSNSE